MNKDQGVYDWAEFELGDSNPRNWGESARGPVNAELVDYYRQQQDQSVNPVTRHGRGCECRNCGWYEMRASGLVEAVRPSVVPSERRPRPLTDQVVPVAVLLVVFTLCSVVLVPVVTPLIGLAAVSTVAIAVSVVALAAVAMVFLMFAMKLRKGFDREPRTLRGRVIGRR